jgi:hypothetical protein
LEDKNRLVFNLQQQVDETKTESEYQLRLKDNKYMEDARLAKKKFQAEINELKQTISKSGFLSFCQTITYLSSASQLPFNHKRTVSIGFELSKICRCSWSDGFCKQKMQSCSKTRGKGSFHILQGFLGIPEVIFIC